MAELDISQRGHMQWGKDAAQLKQEEAKKQAHADAKAQVTEASFDQTEATATSTLSQAATTDMTGQALPKGTTVGSMGQPQLSPPSPNAVQPQANVPQMVQTTVQAYMQNWNPANVTKPTVADTTPVTDPAIIAYAKAHNMTPELAQTHILNSQGDVFRLSVGDQVTTSEMKQLMYAYGDPRAAANLPPNLQKIFQKAMQTAVSQTQKYYGLPSNWKPAQTTTSDMKNTMNTQIQGSYDKNFEQALGELAEKNQMSESDFNMLMGMHYNPTGTFKNVSPQLQQLLKQLNQQAAKATSQQYGIPDEFVGQPRTEYFNAVVNGHYAASLQENLENTKPPLNEQEMKLARQLVENPDMQNIPANVRNAVEQAKTTTLAEIQSAYGLPDDWNPPKKLLSKNVDAAQAKDMRKKTKNAQNAANSAISKAKHHFEKMMPGAVGITVFNYFKAIGQSLNKLSSEMYVIMNSDSEIASVMARAELDSQLNQIAIQRAQLEKIMEQQAKMNGPLGGFLKFLMVLVMFVVALILAVPTGGMSLLMFWIFLTDMLQATFSHKSVYTMTFDAIRKALGNQGGIINLILSIVLSGGNPMLFMELAFQKAHAISDIAQACGASASTANMISMIVQMVLMVAMIVLMAGASFAMGPEAIVADVTIAILQFMEVTIQALGASAQLAEMAAQVIVNILPKLLDIVITALQGWNSVINIQNSLMMAALDKIQAAMEADVTQMQTLVAVINAIVNQILGSLQGTVDFIAAINKFQGKKYNDASLITTQIAQAF